MNKQLLQTKLKSIKHYEQLLKELNEAKEVTANTLDELKNELVKFVDLYKDDIFMIENRVYKFDHANQPSYLYANKGLVTCSAFQAAPTTHGYSNNSTIVEINCLEPNYTLILRASD